MNGLADGTRIDGRWKTAIETCRNRLLLVGVMFLSTFCVIALRLVDVSLFPEGARQTAERLRATPGPDAARADIVDRNGVLLASDVTMPSLIADPRLVVDPAGAAERLAAVLPGLDRETAERKLSSNRRFVWLRRHLTPHQQNLVNRMGIPGLDFRPEVRRVYPLGSLAGHLVGFTDIDGRGLAGVERHFDEALRVKDSALALSVDARVQHALAAELGRALAKFRASGAAGLVMDAATAELLAMVSLPAFNPNFFRLAGKEELFNRAALGVYEMGSVFKIFTTAMALDDGTATLGDRYAATRPLRVSRFVIRDYHPRNRWLTVPEIFRYSSNIGTVRMVLEVGHDRHLGFMSELGMLGPAGLEMPEAGRPLVPATWREINSVTASYGYGLAVTPVHVAAGVSAVVNGGVYRRPTLLRRADGPAAAGRRVISEATSRDMRRLLRLVVERGTGRNAGRTGYLVGGKTGTTEKAAGGGYRKKDLISSFVGAFPMDGPRYVVLVMLDEPRGTAETGGYATGGWVAAPAARAVIRRIAPLLGVAPVAERDPARAALAIGPGGDPRERQVAAH